MPFIALKTLAVRPKLWGVALIPWLISGALTVLLIPSAMGAGSMLITWLAAATGLSVTGWAAKIAGWLVVTVSWVIGALLLTWTASLLALPFADWLSELTEPYCEPPLEVTGALSGWFSRAQLRRLKIDFFKTLAGLIMSALGLMISTLPVLGFAGAGILALGFAFQFLSYPQTRREMGVWDSLFFLLRELPSCLGLGLALLAGFAVPFFSAFLFPVAVIGGTLLFGRIRGRTSSRD